MILILFIVLWFFAAARFLLVLERGGNREKKWRWYPFIPAICGGAVLALLVLTFVCFFILQLVTAFIPLDESGVTAWEWFFLSVISVASYLLLFGLVEFYLHLFIKALNIPLWLTIPIPVSFFTFTLLMISERVTMGPPLSAEMAVAAGGIMAVLGYVTEKWIGFH